MQVLPGVIVNIDDILVAGATKEEHLKRLEDVLTQLERAGVRAQKSRLQLPSLDTEWMWMEYILCQRKWKQL